MPCIADSWPTQQPVSRLCLLKLELGWKRRHQFVTVHSHCPTPISPSQWTAASAIFNVLFDLQAGGARQKEEAIGRRAWLVCGPVQLAPSDIGHREEPAEGSATKLTGVTAPVASAQSTLRILSERENRVCSA